MWSAVALVMLAAPTEAQTREIQDADITAAIVAELVASDAVEGDMIDVSTKDGVVTLSGTVSHLLARDQALEIVERTKGVHAVVDTIGVRPVRRSDDDIQADVKRALLLDPATDSFEIDVQVRGARVTLTGVVDSWAEKQLAGQVAKAVKGVAAIRNNIRATYEEERADSEIEAEVQRRLEFDPYVDAETIEVAVKDGEVSVSGVVGSMFEKSQVGYLAWIPGAKRVDTSDLRVEWWLRDEMERPPRLAVRSDREIERAVKDALSADPRVSPFTIAVASSSGTVTLRGTVDNLKARMAAQRDAENATGVWRVENRLKVRPVNPPSDQYIGKQVEETLARDAVTERHKLTALVRNQQVHLYGEVPTYYVKDRADDVAARVFGVAAVANHIEVTPSATTRNDRRIKEEIEDQFFWSIFVDGSDIVVEVEDGVATLRGKVDSWHELKAAVENTFQAGARAVENRLEVEHAPLEIYPQRYYPSLYWGM
jgi:osmotically-inducible protein OsmY